MTQAKPDPKKVRQGFAIMAVLAVLIILGFASICDSSPEEPAKSDAAALALIRKEPKVKEAFVNDAGMLYVSVEDDGTIRNGYAQYLCEILKENNAAASWVKVVKVNSTNDPKADNAFGVLLGEHNCNE